MVRLLMGTLATLAIGSVGCRDFDTPRTLRGSPRPDRPDLPIEEQERRSRARYALPEDDFRIGPATGIDRPDPVSGGAGSRLGSGGNN
jgi:hypothetical protein